MDNNNVTRKELKDSQMDRITKWFSWNYWRYLLEGTNGMSPRKKWERVICRSKGHPNGVRWFNVNGMEPDMRCVDCDDDLG